jgi:hypothetical protein
MPFLKFPPISPAYSRSLCSSSAFYYFTSSALSEEELEKDLDKMNLAPRATLVVTVQPDDARADALTIVRQCCQYFLYE